MSDTLPKFEISFDPRTRLLRWTMRGFWSIADVAAFDLAMRGARAALKPSSHAINGLSDARDFPVQSREVSVALGALERPASAAVGGRIAIVVGSTMNKLQVHRTLTDDGIRVFLSMDEAEAWLNDKAVDPA